MGKGEAAAFNSKKPANAHASNLFAKVLDQAEKPNATLTDDDIAVEAGSFMVAGTDTTSNTLTYLIWAVLSRPELQRALEDEVAGLGGGQDRTLTDARLEELPLLGAIVEETLRLYGAAPMPLPRIVPEGGVRLGEYFLPAGTNVATQAYTMHRDPEIYRDPET